MSRDHAPSSSSASNSEDIWSKILREKSATSANQASANSTETENSSSSGNTIHQQVIFVGDASSGKSTLIQTFIKPNAAKDSKPTVSLDYNFARKTVNNTKYVANLWEVGGDFLEPKYLEIPITKQTLSSSTIVLTCDLSKPHNVVVSVLRSISAIREILKRRVSELQATNVLLLNELKGSVAAQFNGHVDANRVKPTEVPIVIVGNKFDAMRAMPMGERRLLIQTLRFIAHYFGAALLTVSSNDSVTKDIYRNVMNAVCFNAGNIKAASDINLDKFVYITRGQDSFEQILFSGIHVTPSADSSEASKVRHSITHNRPS
jgi:dynein light intermediate chain 2